MLVAAAKTDHGVAAECLMTFLRPGRDRMPCDGRAEHDVGDEPRTRAPISDGARAREKAGAVLVAEALHALGLLRRALTTEGGRG